MLSAATTAKSGRSGNALKNRLKPGLRFLVPSMPGRSNSRSAPLGLFEDHNVPRHISIGDDGLLGDASVLQDPAPMVKERRPRAQREGGHSVRLGIVLMFEQDREVGFNDILQQQEQGHPGHLATDGGALSGAE